MFPTEGCRFSILLQQEFYKFPEVKSLFLISGGFDLLLLVEGDTMKDIAFFRSGKIGLLLTM